MKKYDKIKQLGDEENKELLTSPEDEIVIEEKLDGANTRFMIKNGKVIFGSHSQQLTSDDGNPDNVNKNFKKSYELIKSKIEPLPASILAELEGLTFFGETMIRHTLDYDWNNIPAFVGFDIYNAKLEKYCEWSHARLLFSELNIEFVPVLWHGQVKDFKIEDWTDDKMPKAKWASQSSPDQQVEGICIKNFVKQLMGKIVRTKFIEKNIKTFGGGKKKARTEGNNDAEVCAIYCTNARIDKQVFKMLDEDKKLSMELMGELIRRVCADVFEESWKDIVWSQWIINFKKLRGLIAKRCQEVLKQMLINNAILISGNEVGK